MDNYMKPKLKTEDEVEETEEEVKGFIYYEQILVKKLQHYYLSGDIEVPVAYVDMIHRIRTATPDETITIHLNTQGGDLSAGLQIVNAMKYSQAHIIASLEGEAFSLGSLIFLAADEFLIHDNSLMMIHNFSGGSYGKGNEQVSYIEATMKWFKQLAQDYYVPFITEKELAEVLKDNDIYLQTDDIRKRVVRMVKIHQKEQKKSDEVAK